MKDISEQISNIMKITPNNNYACYLYPNSLLLYMLLTLLHNSGHQYLCLPPHADEDLEIGFTDSPLAAEAVGD